MMGKVWRLLLLAILVNASLATMTLARPVYLADGGIIEAQRVWQDEGEVFVLLNRDSLITFSPEQLNLKKTFAEKWQKRPHSSAHKRVKAPVAVARIAPVAPAAPAVAKLPASPAVGVPAAKSATAAQGSNPAKAAPPVIASAATSPPAAVQAAKVMTPPVTPPAKTAPAPIAAKPTPRPRPAVVPPPAEGSSMMVFALLGVILLFVLVIIASYWKVFEKAGQAGWKSLIPIYNLFVVLQISGSPSWWLLMFFLPVVNIYFLVVMHIRLAEKFGKTPLFGFALCFLGFIFFPILAFGSATYEGEEMFTFDEEEQL